MSESDTFITRWLRLKQEAATATPSTEPLDLAKLPPIESLTSESDLSVFLQSGVPADMLRAALRRAWRLDPKIQGFIGIAESQWDFNDPHAMPGFGPLELKDDAAAVVSRSMPISDRAAEAPVLTQQDLNPHRDGQLDPVWLSGEPSRSGTTTGTTMDSERRGSPVGSAAENPKNPRRHGSALPRAIR